MGDIADRLLSVLDGEAARDKVGRYFGDDGPGSEMFSGRLFELFDGGGDHPVSANRFTPGDVLAVQALSVVVPTEAAFAMLHGELARELFDLLSAIPLTVDLGTDAALEHVTENAAASRAWTLLTELSGVGWVTAGKLMARKRPRLVPIYDDVVRCRLGKPDNFWRALHEALQDKRVMTALDSLGQVAPRHVSRIRVVDVAVWMDHRSDHRSCKHASSAS